MSAIWDTVLALPYNSTFYCDTRGRIEVFPQLSDLQSTTYQDDWDFSLVVFDCNTGDPIGIVQYLAQKLDLASARNVAILKYQLAYLSESCSFTPHGVLYGLIVDSKQNLATWRMNVAIQDNFNFSHAIKRNGETLYYSLFQDGRAAFYF